MISDHTVCVQKFFREVVIWKHLSHPNIVPLLGVAPELFPLCMVSQWMPQGNIRTYAQDKPVATKLQLVSCIGKPLALPTVLFQLKDILSGLEYLHCQPIVHGDLKGVRRFCGILPLTDFDQSLMAG